MKAGLADTLSVLVFSLAFGQNRREYYNLEVQLKSQISFCLRQYFPGTKPLRQANTQIRYAILGM